MNQHVRMTGLGKLSYDPEKRKLSNGTRFVSLSLVEDVIYLELLREPANSEQLLKKLQEKCGHPYSTGTIFASVGTLKEKLRYLKAGKCLKKKKKIIHITTYSLAL